jgi:hypothetical protein
MADLFFAVSCQSRRCRAEMGAAMAIASQTQKKRMRPDRRIGRDPLTGLADHRAMLLRRRSLLLVAPLLLAAPARAAVPGLELERVGDQVALTGRGIRRPLLLPATGARLLAPLAAGGEVLVVAAFRQEDGEAAMDWGALAMTLDGTVALLALEPLAWRAGGARMATRISAAGDRRQVAFQRDSAVPASPTLWRREAWTDYLAWRTPVGLADAPVRVPPAGTRQAVVAEWRRRAAALVAREPAAITPALLAEAGLQAAGLSLATSRQPSISQPCGPRTIV